MKFNDIVKIGFWGLVGYYLLKEFSQPTNDANYNKPSQTPGFNWNSSPNVPDPQPHYAPPTLDVRGIVEEAFRRTFEKPIVTSFGDYSVPSQLETQRTTAVPDPQTVERAEWLKLIRHPCVIIILGGRDKGKSALGYKGLEYLEWTGIKLFVLGFPDDAGKLLPDSIGVIDSLEEAPINSAILVDETYLGYHARRTMAKSSVEMCQTINLSWQRNQTLIYVSQEGRQIDINIISQADMIIFKEPSAFQLEYERLELKKFAIKAKNVFGTISGNKKRYSYVFAPGLEFEGLMQNSLPLFWTPQLSKVYATVGRVKPRAAKKMSLEQKIDAGADFAITQVFFDNHFFYDFMEWAEKAGISIPIIPGIMPITDIEKIKRFSQMCGATLPVSLVERMQKATSADEARRFGIDFATGQCQDLWRNGVRYFHFYTLNHSQAVTEILHNLGPMEKAEPIGR